jgi:hypothetical protein
VGVRARCREYDALDDLRFVYGADVVVEFSAQPNSAEAKRGGDP